MMADIKDGWTHKTTAYCGECYQLAWVLLGVCEECWKAVEDPQ